MSKNISHEKVNNDLYLFLRTIYHYERNMANRFGLNYEQVYLLQNLRRVSPQRLTEIAATLDIPMFSASRLVERLVQMKLVSKEKGVEDHRSISVKLLPAGEQLVRKIEDDSYDRIMENATEMSDAELEGMFQVGEKVYAVLGIPRNKVQ
jgi:DNA-binding MarR family transcriptional regulator